MPQNEPVHVRQWVLWSAAAFFTGLMLAEFAYDASPRSGSRLRPLPFGARLLVGGLFGASVGGSTGSGWLLTAAAGVGGAITGTLGGAYLRRVLARAFGRDWPAAMVGDVVAVTGALALGVALH